MLCLVVTAWGCSEDVVEEPIRPPLDAGRFDATKPPELSCSVGKDEYGIALIDDPVLQSLASCRSDRDCVAWSPQLNCEGEALDVYQCDRATRVDALEMTLQRNKVVSASICPRIDPQCYVGNLCGSNGRARCIEGICDISYGDDDGGAPDAR